MPGLKKGTVKLVSHDENWHQIFADEEMRLLKAIGEFVIAVEHIGSTSICGIAAKPILDIAVAISDKANGEKCVVPLENAGYEYRGENGIDGRFYFVKGAPRTHHLHMLLANSRELHNHLAFRDFLLQNLFAAEEYDRLKTYLAQKYRNDREAYLDGKADFIRKTLKIARF